MDTNLNAKALQIIYQMSESNYFSLLQPHKKKLDELANYRLSKTGKNIKRQNYNIQQLEYIVNKILDTPFGYEFNGLTLIKTNE
jgi:hypothetical protein